MSVPESIQSAMQQTNQLFGATVIKARNFDALDQVYTPDAHILPPGAPMMEGLAAIKAYWQQGVESMDVQGATLNSIHAEMAGDTIVEIGSAQLSFPNGQSAAVKYVVHWKQHAGLWKWYTDIWNMNP